MAQTQQRNLGKISLINGDENRSVVATAVIITERGVVKIKDEAKGTYILCGCDSKPSLCMCVRWVHQYKDKIQKKASTSMTQTLQPDMLQMLQRRKRKKQKNQKQHINVKRHLFVVSIVSLSLNFHLCLFAHHSVCLHCHCLHLPSSHFRCLLNFCNSLNKIQHRLTFNQFPNSKL